MGWCSPIKRYTDGAGSVGCNTLVYVVHLENGEDLESFRLAHASKLPLLWNNDVSMKFQLIS